MQDTVAGHFVLYEPPTENAKAGNLAYGVNGHCMPLVCLYRFLGVDLTVTSFA